MAGMDFLLANLLGVKPEIVKELMATAPQKITEAVELIKTTAKRIDDRFAAIERRLEAIENIARVPIVDNERAETENDGKRTGTDG